MDYLLRTDTAVEMTAALQGAGLVVETTFSDGEQGFAPVDGAYVDWIGAIPTVLDPEGEVVRLGDPRYHANLRVTFVLTEEQVEALPTFEPVPSIPFRAFL